MATARLVGRFRRLSRRLIFTSETRVMLLTCIAGLGALSGRVRRLFSVHRLACFVRVLRFRCLRMLTVSWRRGGLSRGLLVSVGRMVAGLGRLRTLRARRRSWWMAMSLCRRRCVYIGMVKRLRSEEHTSELQ